MNKKQKSLTNKGFSLVELIIVIAIMAVLVGVLAPQYLKYVHNSKVSTDAQNAQEMATAINVAIADQKAAFSAANTVNWTAVGVSAPVSKLTTNNTSWKVEGDNTTGVTAIKLTYNGTDYICYPNPDTASTGINTLKQ